MVTLLLGFESMAAPVLALGIGGTIGVLGAAFALGVRHGIDWDHIAAITDITSSAATVDDADTSWLMREPAIMLTDESHHERGGHAHAAQMVATTAVAGAGVATGFPAHQHSISELGHRHNGVGSHAAVAKARSFVRKQKPALWLGTMYALGHGSVVVVLGLSALLLRQVLPDWIDPVMERVVGVTLIMLAVYLLFSLWQYFRGGADFRLRSRWMVVFAGVSHGWHALQSRLFGKRVVHEHAHDSQQYGARSAYAVGAIHGVGAETGTQVLVIATAVGASSQVMGVFALAAFVVGLLVSNTFVTVVTAAGFVSSQQRRGVYIGVGVVAAVFSLVVGVLFLFQASGSLPDLGQYFEWIGGPAS